MSESIIDLLCPVGGVEGSIAATMECVRVHCGYEYNSGRVHFVLGMYLFILRVSNRCVDLSICFSVYKAAFLL